VDFFILKFSRGEKHLQYCLKRRCDHIIFPDRLEPDQVWNGSTEIREVSLTLQMPFYPVAYGIGVCCFIQCLVMVCDIVKISGGKFDE